MTIRQVTHGLLFATAVAFACGCGSGAKSVDERKTATTSTRGPNQNVDVNCLADHIENPPDPYHYSFKSMNGQNAVDKEADITPQSMDITVQDESGSHKYHGDHSQGANWDTAMMALTGSGLTAMTARIGFIQKTSALKRIDDEPMNGYDTTQYAIDTTSGNGSDTQTFRTMFGAGSYDKGKIWVTAQGCPVKLVLDEATQRNNGNVDNLHFEIAVNKK